MPRFILAVAVAQACDAESGRSGVPASLCLGARGVGLGRAFLYANGVWGEAGARRVVQSKFCFVILDPYLALSILLFF